MLRGSRSCRSKSCPARQAIASQEFAQSGARSTGCNWCRAARLRPATPCETFDTVEGLATGIRTTRPDHVAACYADGIWETAYGSTPLAAGHGARTWWSKAGCFAGDLRIWPMHNHSAGGGYSWARRGRDCFVGCTCTTKCCLILQSRPRSTPTSVVPAPDPIVIRPLMSTAEARKELGIVGEGTWIGMAGVIARFKPFRVSRPIASVACAAINLSARSLDRCRATFARCFKRSRIVVGSRLEASSSSIAFCRSRRCMRGRSGRSRRGTLSETPKPFEHYFLGGSRRSAVHRPDGRLPPTTSFGVSDWVSAARSRSPKFWRMRFPVHFARRGLTRTYFECRGVSSQEKLPGNLVQPGTGAARNYRTERSPVDFGLNRLRLSLFRECRTNLPPRQNRRAARCERKRLTA